jgi:hypothetical protein
MSLEVEHAVGFVLLVAAVELVGVGLGVVVFAPGVATVSSSEVFADLEPT